MWKSTNGIYSSYHERNRTEIKTDDSLIIGVGLGQLCAAAVSCATTIIDLPDTAVDAVRLAFRTGAAVENLSVRNEGNEVRNGCWSLAVPIAYRDLKEELTTVQDLAVGTSKKGVNTWASILIE